MRANSVNDSGNVSMDRPQAFDANPVQTEGVARASAPRVAKVSLLRKIATAFLVVAVMATIALIAIAATVATPAGLIAAGVILGASVLGSAILWPLSAVADRAVLLMDKIDPLVNRVDGILDEVTGVLEKAAGLLANGQVAMDEIPKILKQASQAMDEATEILNKVGGAVDKTAVAVTSAANTLRHVEQMVEDKDPEIRQGVSDALEVVRKVKKTLCVKEALSGFVKGKRDYVVQGAQKVAGIAQRATAAAAEKVRGAIGSLRPKNAGTGPVPPLSNVPRESTAASTTFAAHASMNSEGENLQTVVRWPSQFAEGAGTAPGNRREIAGVASEDPDTARDASVLRNPVQPREGAPLARNDANGQENSEVASHSLGMDPIESELATQDPLKVAHQLGRDGVARAVAHARPQSLIRRAADGIGQGIQSTAQKSVAMARAGWKLLAAMLPGKRNGKDGVDA